MLLFSFHGMEPRSYGTFVFLYLILNKSSTLSSWVDVFSCDAGVFIYFSCTARLGEVHTRAKNDLFHWLTLATSLKIHLHETAHANVSSIIPSTQIISIYMNAVANIYFLAFFISLLLQKVRMQILLKLASPRVFARRTNRSHLTICKSSECRSHSFISMR